MFALFLTPAYLPFAIAFVVMIGIGLIEAVGLGLGHVHLDVAPGADAGADMGTDVSAGGLLDGLGLGDELPILIWLTSLLGCFTLAGIAVQQVASAIGGAPLGWGPAAGLAAMIGVPFNTLVANGLARIMPGFETTAISTDDLLRYRGTILEGTARRGSPARAKVIDLHGQAHFLMVEPQGDADVIGTGETVLLVRRDGALFFAVADANMFLQPI